MQKQLEPLTSIRFLFALLVVLFHGLEPRPDTLDVFPGLLKTVISHGYVGVSFFFVLSGFILAYSYAGRVRQPSDEAAKRPSAGRGRHAYCQPTIWPSCSICPSSLSLLLLQMRRGSLLSTR